MSWSSPSSPPLRATAASTFGSLRAETGIVSLDYGFANTAATKSGVSFVDGIAGELRYRGYPIEQLAERSTFLEVAYLLFHGELPSPKQLEEYRADITRHTLLDEEMRQLFDAFPRDAHPMAILASATNAMATFYPDFDNPIDPSRSSSRRSTWSPRCRPWPPSPTRSRPASPTSTRATTSTTCPTSST